MLSTVLCLHLLPRWITPSLSFIMKSLSCHWWCWRLAYYWGKIRWFKAGTCFHIPKRKEGRFCIVREPTIDMRQESGADCFKRCFDVIFSVRKLECVCVYMIHIVWICLKKENTGRMRVGGEGKWFPIRDGDRSRK